MKEGTADICLRRTGRDCEVGVRAPGEGLLGAPEHQGNQKRCDGGDDEIPVTPKPKVPQSHKSKNKLKTKNKAK